jgi:hypothetical protein
MGEGDKGIKYFYYILFTHLGFSWEKWLHELLGEGHVVLYCMQLYKPLFWVVWGFITHFIVPKSLLHIPLHSLYWSGHGK